MEADLEIAYKWPEGWGDDTIVDNAADSSPFIGVLALWVAWGTSVKDGVVMVCTELEELFTISVRGRLSREVRGARGLCGVAVRVGEDIVTDMRGGTRGGGVVGIEISHKEGMGVCRDALTGLVEEVKRVSVGRLEIGTMFWREVNGEDI